MPILPATGYKPPVFLRNRHLHSAYPVFFRKVDYPQVARERFTLSDGDFIDLDITTANNNKAVLLIHGFEGNAQSVYMLAMGKAYLKRGFDVIAMNLRGCSGEPNKLFRAYHSGATDDLHEVVQHIVKKEYQQLVLTAFSLGANILLKYLGEQQTNLSPKIKAAVAISAPCDLDKAEIALSPVYAYWFLKSLIPKTKEKMKRFPDNILGNKIPRIKSIREFDDFYTAPVHGYEDVDDYYLKCSSIYFLEKIKLPTLLLTAQDDPFLSLESIPFEIAKSHDFLYLMSPFKGGHVAFAKLGSDNEYWGEQRAVEFVSQYIEDSTQ